MIVNEEIGYVLETIRFKTSIYRDKKKSGNWFNTSWFCWNVLPKQLIFEELNK